MSWWFSLFARSAISEDRMPVLSRRHSFHYCFYVILQNIRHKTCGHDQQLACSEQQKQLMIDNCHDITL
jgi:hypothetical protein